MAKHETDSDDDEQTVTKLWHNQPFFQPEDTGRNKWARASVHLTAAILLGRNFQTFDRRPDNSTITYASCFNLSSLNPFSHRSGKATGPRNPDTAHAIRLRSYNPFNLDTFNPFSLCFSSG